MNATPYAEIIGDPVAQSKSPAIYNFWLEKAGLSGEYRRQLVGADGLADYITDRRDDLAWRGCNITMPHKQAVMPLLDRLDPLAQRIGAVNTVVRCEDGSLKGYNTDAPGFLEPLRAILRQKHLFRMARIIGTGGAARAIVSALAEENFVLVLAGREIKKAAAVLAECASGTDHHVVALDHFGPPTEFVFDDREGSLDLIVNASPLGMRDQAPLEFDLSHAPPGSIFYDIVTDPVRTPLLEAASARGFPVVDGISMLIGQARTAFQLFFGQNASAEHDAELRERLTT